MCPHWSIKTPCPLLKRKKGEQILLKHCANLKLVANGYQKLQKADMVEKDDYAH
jgi:hypothetical protein